MKKKLILLLAIFIILPLCSDFLYTSLAQQSDEEDFVSAVFINTAYNEDFPAKSGMSSKELREEISNIINFVKDNGYNTVFFEGVTGGEAMYTSKDIPFSRFLNKGSGFLIAPDPLAIFVEEGKKAGIDIYCVIDPFYISNEEEEINQNSYAYQNPTHTFIKDEDLFLNPTSEEVSKYIARISHELATKYDIEGIVFGGLDNSGLLSTVAYYEEITEMVSLAAENIKDRGKEVGILLNSSSNTTTLAQQLIKTISAQTELDFIMPYMFKSVDSGEYTSELERWKELSDSVDTKLITINKASKTSRPTSDENMYSNPYEMNYQYITNTMMGINGFCVDSLWSVSDKLSPINYRLSPLLKSEALPLTTEYKIEGSLSLNTLENNIISTADSYYVSGVSDPSEPLYVNDVLVENVAKNGIFGIDLALEDSFNRFVFEQGNLRQTLIIRSDEEPKEDEERIAEIIADSAYPTTTKAIAFGGSIEVSCVAPAGASVTATLSGMSVSLQQKEEQTIGKPVEYIGKIPYNPAYADEEITDLGKISYALTNRNTVSIVRSRGSVVQLSEARVPVASVVDYKAGVSAEPIDNGNYSFILKNGAKDYIVGEEGDFYKLYCGGYINKDDVEIEKNLTTAEGEYTEYYVQNDESSEIYLLKGTTSPPIKTEISENQLIVKFYNTIDMPKMLPASEEVFEEIIAVPGENNTYELRFVFAEDSKFWGYDINYTGTDSRDTEIYIKYTPEISFSDGEPLKDVRVVIDAGGGGEEDIGDLTAVGTLGPSEAELNLNLALNTKEVLEELGADVVLTRGEDTYINEFDRVRTNNSAKGDFFISINHSGTQNGKNPENLGGVNVYYQYRMHMDFAGEIAYEISQGANRAQKENTLAYMPTIGTTLCPSVIIEVGNVSNPEDYIKLIDPMQSYKVSSSIANAIIDYLKMPSQYD